MEIAILNNGALSWGNPVVIQITNAIPPVECNSYQVLIRIEKIISQNQTSLVSLDAFWPDQNNAIEQDFAPYIRSAGNYKIRFGEAYFSIINGEDGFWESYFIDEYEETIELPNATIVENAYYSIPMGNVQLSGNPIQIIIPTTAQKMSGKPNFKLLLKATCALLLGSPFVEEITPDSNKLSKFDISGLVDQPVTYDFEFPPVGVFTDHRPLELNVAIDTGESWIDAHGVRQETWNNLASNTYFIRVLKGKLRAHELALLNEIGQNFTTEYINKGRFLTHLSDNQLVAPGQIVKLWYLSRFSILVNAVWFCEVTQMTNYGPHTYNDLAGTFTLDPNSGLLEFNVEPIFMGYNRTVTEQYPILSFKVWFCNADTGVIISESKTFVVDPTYYENTFHFLYVNPLSGIDCLRLTGNYSNNLNAEEETLYQPVPIGSATKVASIKTVSVTAQRSWEINTGLKSSLTEMNDLRDLLESKDCWMVDPEHPSRLIPVRVEKDKFKLFDSMNDVHSINLKITEAHR